MKARDVMTPVPVVRQEDPCSEVIRQIQQPEIRAVAVVREDGELVGMVTDADVVTALLPSYVLADEALAGVLEEEAGAGLPARLRQKRVRELVDAVRRDRPVVTTDDTLIEVGAALARSNDPAVVVVEGRRPVGVVTIDRLLEAFLGGER